ncbi:MAG TPA: TonB-dependent receptor, partial [Vicinamibacterales bacterium]|nr:TonB-dependent receptor [Vicinamibacterales bacterium]
MMELFRGRPCGLRCGLAIVLALAAAIPARAQVFTGRIDITVQDSSGAVLPGVTVEISGPQQQSAVTDTAGEAHFLNLAPGTYEVRATLQGFADYLNREVPVGAGTSIPLRVSLSVAGVAEQVTVEGGAPVIDVKRQTVSTNVNVDELQNIPSSRDPWVVLQTVPSISVDRVNVGGAESGQQSNYTAKGADFGDNTWYIDGIPITDMTALGSSPTYYDFDMFQEMQVTTGGADPAAATPGVQLNFVLKSGTNQPRGTSRIFFANEDLQSNNMPQELVDQGLGGTSGKGNRTDQYADYGVEFGGPLLRDKWWGWGSYAKTDVRILTLNGVTDRTILEDAGFKTNAQFSDAWRGGFTFFSGNKKKDGRGAGPFNPPETTFVQDGPSKVYKGEVNHVANNNLFITARGAFVNGPFTLEPKGGRDKQVFIDANGVYHNTNQYLDTQRPQRTVLADASWFRGRHEVKFGASWRRVEDETFFGFGNGWLNIELDGDSGLTLAIPFRDYYQKNSGDYSSAYIGDTITWDRLTANIALRYDRTTNSALEASQPAHPDLPQVLPAVNAPAVNNAIVWNTWSPRIGATYALDESRRTLVRGSYASFASQLNVTEAGEVSASSYAYAYYLAIDANRSFSTEPSELIQQISVIGVDPSDPLKVVNQIQPDLKSPRTHEVVVGLDRELMPNFGVSAAFTWRRFNDVLWYPLIGVTSADYVEDGRITADAGEIA